MKPDDVSLDVPRSMTMEVPEYLVWSLAIQHAQERAFGHGEDVAASVAGAMANGLTEFHFQLPTSVVEGLVVRHLQGRGFVVEGWDAYGRVAWVAVDPKRSDRALIQRGFDNPRPSSGDG